MILDVIEWISLGGFALLFVTLFIWWIRRSIRGDAPRNTEAGGDRSGAADATATGSITGHGGHAW